MLTHTHTHTHTQTHCVDLNLNQENRLVILYDERGRKRDSEEGRQ